MSVVPGGSTNCGVTHHSIEIGNLSMLYEDFSKRTRACVLYSPWAIPKFARSIDYAEHCRLTFTI